MSSWLVGVAVLLVLALVAVVIAIAVLGWMFWKRRMQSRDIRQLP